MKTKKQLRNFIVFVALAVCLGSFFNVGFGQVKLLKFAVFSSNFGTYITTTKPNVTLLKSKLNFQGLNEVEYKIYNNTLSIKSLASSNNLDVSNDLSDLVSDKVDSLKDEEFNDIINSMSDQQRNVFNASSFSEKIKRLVAGDEQFNVKSIIELLFAFLLDNLAGIVPILAMICAIAIISSILLQIRGEALNKPLGDVIHFACFSVIVLIVATSVVQLVSLTSSTLENLKKQMEIAFPLLLTLMASLGAGASVSIYQPLVAVLCGIMMELFTKVVLPIFVFGMIFNIVGNMSSSVKLSKLTKFFNSLFKYVIGFTFTIFSGCLAISGIMAGSYDGVSIRATKYAMKSYIPIMGGYLADGFNLIMASSVLIKNAIGYSGLLVMFLTIVSPLLKITLYKLGLSFVSGLIEPVADGRVTNFVSSTSKSLSMLSSIILAFSFAYLICVGLMMCTSNFL